MATTNTNLKIAFDSWYLRSRFRNRGTYVYASQILVHLRELARGCPVQIMPFVTNGAEDDARTVAPAPGFEPLTSGLLKHERLWRYGGAWAATVLSRADVVFSPGPNSLQFPSRAAKVTTIHDATPVLMPNFAPPGIIRKLRWQMRWAVRRSDHIIAISESCKRDLMRVYGVPESRISVIYSGYDKAHFNQVPAQPEHLAAARQKHGLDKPYIFHHGLMQPRKNLKRLIEAYYLLQRRNRELETDLVLAGPLGWRGEELLESARPIKGRKGIVIFTGALEEMELAVLLKGAVLAVIPSLYEGFCLPMVEAMACGVATVVSRSSCLPEVSGGVLRYFDPESVEEMANCIETVLGTDALRKEIADKGVVRAQRFDWRRSAEETLQVLMAARKD